MILSNTHDAFNILDSNDSVSSAAVYPGSTEETVLIVKWANRYEIPIYPISMGRNLGYGGAAPRVRGSVILDMGRRMNKVLKIDGSNCSCLVEPGVSYFKLYEEVQKSGLPLWIDCPDIGGGSVLGNAIDRGVGYTPYGDHFANHCGMEVVLPTGDVIRTGMGALPGPNGEDNPTWQSFQYGFGPYMDGIFSQSNYGIVTKMGMWLMPATECLSFMITFPREEDFEQIVEIMRPLMISNVFGNIPQIRHVVEEIAVTGKPKSFFYKGKDRLPREVMREHAKNMPCGDCTWIFYGTLYGTPTERQPNLERVKRDFSKIKGSKFIVPDDVPEDHYLHSRQSVCSGIPVLRELDWLNWVPNAAHLFFAPITPSNGKIARKLYDMVLKRHIEYDFDLIPAYTIGVREMHMIVNIVYNRADPDARRRALECMRKMIDDCAREGFGEYRTHILLADQVQATYGWNNQASRKFNETIKDSLDPKGILAPGRSGIWPRKYRNKGWELYYGDNRTTSSPATTKTSKL